MNFMNTEFWHSPDNHLLLNPRLPLEIKKVYESAWKEFVIGKRSSIIGIATSGSSGELGRLILQSKPALLASARAANQRFEAGPRDIWLRSLPTFHVGGLQISGRAFLAGSQVIESGFGFGRAKWDAAAFADELATSRATLLSLVPTQLFDLVRLGLRAPPSLRAIVVGGGRLEPGLQKSARCLGWPALPSYGLTECGSQVATAHLPGDDPRLWPLAHVELRTDSAQRLEIRSAGLLQAQIRFQNGAPIFEDPKHDGWFTSEDRAQIETDGSVKILGRDQDFIKIGGEGVVLSRLEETLERVKRELPWPMTGDTNVDVALLAAHDPRLGVKIVLIVGGASAAHLPAAVQSLRQAYDQAVMPYERIREVHGLKAIPRSALGKLIRLEALALVGLEPVVDMGRNG